MKSKVSVTVNSDVLTKARQLAILRSKSLSQMVEDSLETAMHNHNTAK